MALSGNYGGAYLWQSQGNNISKIRFVEPKPNFEVKFYSETEGTSNKWAKGCSVYLPHKKFNNQIFFHNRIAPT